MTARQTSAILERTEVICLVVLIVATPTVFLRNTFSTFDIPQVTVLWLAAMTMGLIAVARRLVFGPDASLPRPVMVAVAAFLTSLGVNVALSPQPWVAFTGLPVRGAGALTYGFCLLIFLSAYGIVTRRGPATIVTAFVVAHGFVSGYALLQAYGGDPYQWGEGELWVSPVFSTLGNPNFSSAYLAVTLPLVTWLAFGSAYGRWIRVLGGALLGATTVALSYLDSFQGGLAALVSLAVVANWAWYRVRGGRLVATAVAAPATLAIVGVPILLQEPGRAVLVAVVACLGVTGWLSLEWDQRHPSLVDPVVIGWNRRRSVLASASAVAAVAVTVLVAGSRITDELRSGLGQRIEFWRTSLSIFREHPILGTGLETYPAYYTRHRPISHAVEWEFVLSDSPHSVPLGLLSGGGLLMVGTYAALVGLIGWIGYRAVCRTGGSVRMVTVAVLAAWVAFQVQSLVSIDMPGLIATHWVFGGVLLASYETVGFGGDTPTVDSSPPSQRVAANRVPWWRWSYLCLASVAWVVLLGPVTSPFRADMAAGQAQLALSVGDVQTGGERLLEATALQPRRSLYADGMALVYSESDLHKLAYEEFARSAELQPGNPFAAAQAGQAATRIGRNELASSWFERAIADGPNQAGVLADAAFFNAAIGRGDRSTEVLASFEALRSPNTSAWYVVQETYRLLGDIENVDRVIPCATTGQVGCRPRG